jgi:hypothetical protein
MQLQQILNFSEDILSEARKKLNRKSQNEIIFQDLRSEESSGRILCPFCLYSSPKNKMSAVVKNGCFKCFSCGKFGRVDQ